jgi:biotin carboxyl carrier protein
MKMEHALVAPFDGRVTQVSGSAGAQVAQGAMIVTIERDQGDRT